MGAMGEDVAAKLREMRLDEAVPSGSAAGVSGGAGKAKGVVGVRPLVLAGAVS